MSQTAAISARVTITALDLSGNSVAKTFSDVYELGFDYFKGVLRIYDHTQGTFYFSLKTPTTLTYTIAGTTATVVIS